MLPNVPVTCRASAVVCVETCIDKVMGVHLYTDYIMKEINKINL